MIHHLARAFLVRDAALRGAAHALQTGAGSGQPPGERKAGTPASAPLRPVRARPITPWPAPPHRPAVDDNVRRVRICTDPSDARRTVIAGRFAEVCAALDRLVREQEAAA